VGIDLSALALEDFFLENKLSYEKDDIDGFVRFTGTQDAKGITLLAGDYFSLKPSMTAHCQALYDRAALIAMPNTMRADYVDHLVTLMPTASHGLLLAIAYDQSLMHGPPFSVSDEHVRTLLHTGFDVNELAHYSGPERVGNLADRGLETLDERVYLLSRK
jgi:thiopurine S-methyltransferase